MEVVLAQPLADRSAFFVERVFLHLCLGRAFDGILVCGLPGVADDPHRLALCPANHHTANGLEYVQRFENGHPVAIHLAERQFARSKHALVKFVDCWWHIE